MSFQPLFPVRFSYDLKFGFVALALSNSICFVFADMSNLKTDKGLALADIITCVHGYVELLTLPADVRMYLLDKLADIEYKLAMGATEKLQMTALLGGFKVAVDMAAKESIAK